MKRSNNCVEYTTVACIYGIHFESIIIRVDIIIYSSPVCWFVGAERARFSRGHDNVSEVKSFILR